MLYLLFGLLLAVLLFYRLRKSINYLSQKKADAGTPQQSTKSMPVSPAQNDKLVLINGVSHEDLKSAVTSFGKMYNEDSYIVLPRVYKLSGQEFAVTFPYDVDFEIFCYFVNYMEHPIDIKWTANVTGWMTIAANGIWVTDQIARKQIMVFIPEEEAEHDNVHFTTSENVGYRQNFAGGTKPMNAPTRPYIPPPLDLAVLRGNQFEDFR